MHLNEREGRYWPYDSNLPLNYGEEGYAGVELVKGERWVW